MTNPLIQGLLGRDVVLLSEDVSLATPLTLTRISQGFEQLAFRA